MEAKINKWGNSLGVRIPSGYLPITGFSEKTRVEIIAEPDKLIITRVNKPEPYMPLSQYLASCGWNGEQFKSREVNFGDAVRAEGYM